MRSERRVGVHGERANRRLPLDDGDVHIWWVNVPPYDRLDPHLAILAPVERERSAAFRFDEDRQRFLSSRVALRRILALYVESPPERLRFERSKRGKPCLRENPDGIEFNLSRSREWACVAVAMRSSVGVDIETLTDLPDLEQLAPRCLCGRELARYEPMGHEERLRTFYRIWTAKEAYVKCLGSGLLLPFQSLTVRWTSKTGAFLVGEEGGAPDLDHSLEGRTLDMPHSLYGAIVLGCPIQQIRHHDFSWV